MDFRWLRLLDGTSLGSFSLEQSVMKQIMMHNEVLAVKLHSAVNVQMIQNNPGKQFFTSKHYRAILEVISISQSIVFQFLKVM